MGLKEFELSSNMDKEEFFWRSGKFISNFSKAN
jgi:hypothetical protein